jgi:hypothetical protein
MTSDGTTRRDSIFVATDVVEQVVAPAIALISTPLVEQGKALRPKTCISQLINGSQKPSSRFIMTNVTNETARNL